MNNCIRPLPAWISIPEFDRKKYAKTMGIVDSCGLHTVCVEANCPNRYECFSRGAATFLILGDICTRNCRYCNIRKGTPGPPDEGEPARVAGAAGKLGLKYAVVTSVTRDDLEDGGAEIFAETARRLKKAIPGCGIELLIPDLGGNWDALKEILDSSPDVLNHNIETVERLFPALRPKGSYRRSLALLRKSGELHPEIPAKSGLMIGLGETIDEVFSTIEDLADAGCSMLTVGQYLQPTPAHAEVKRFYGPAEYEEIRAFAKEAGFGFVRSGPLVRSSYHADEMRRFEK